MPFCISISICTDTNKHIITDDEVIKVVRMNVGFFKLVRTRSCYPDPIDDTYTLSIELEDAPSEQVDKIVSTLKTRFVCYNATVTVHDARAKQV